MKFDVIISGERHDAVIVLKDNETGSVVTVFGFGALLNEFRVSNNQALQKNIIDGFDSLQDAKDNMVNSFKSARLSPFVCRLKNGDYSFEGTHHHIDKFYLGKAALHGLLFDATFVINKYDISDDHASLTLEYNYSRADEGFPYPFNTKVQYSLSAGNTLFIETTITNTGQTNMPLCDGWHPYFIVGETINEASLQINCNTMIEFDTDLLPTGNLIAYNNFETTNKIGDTFLDNCFLLKDAEKPACILKDLSAGLQLIIETDSHYPYLQIYTPDHRQSIAIENLSSVPDAFNNKMGLQMIQPHESKIFSVSYTANLL